MESPIKSSFIPEDAEREVRVSKSAGGAVDLFVLASLVIFVASLALAGGMFLYGQYVETSRASKSTQLERARAAFEPSLINTITRLDDRMQSADAILGVHIAPSAFFHVLEQVTLNTVSFRSLTFDAVDPQRITIKMRGLAESVNSIALQADLFTKIGVITSPIFSNIDREIDGVNFDVSAFVNPSTIRYVSLLSAALSQGQVSNENPVPPSSQLPEDGADPFGSFEQ